MCSILERKIIDNGNRLVIVGLSISGMYMDGFQIFDIPCSLSVAIWLWLKECDQVVEKCLDCAKRTFPA